MSDTIMKVYNKITDLIENTLLLELAKHPENKGKQ